MATVGNNCQASMSPGLTRHWHRCRQNQGPISPGRSSPRVQHFRSRVIAPSPSFLCPHPYAASPRSNRIHAGALRSEFFPGQGRRQGKPASPRGCQRGDAAVLLPPRRDARETPGAQTKKLPPVRLPHNIRQSRHRDAMDPRQKRRRLPAYKRTAVSARSDTEKSGIPAAFLQP